MAGIETRAYADLSRCMSHALRHEPWIYELELDDEGWAPLEQLLGALRVQRPTWSSLQVSDLEGVIESSSKKRHELKGDRIRALYGHSIPGKLRKVPATPPSVLYHGTLPEAVSRILVEGLRPMGRQFVHMSVDENTAGEVGRRKSKKPTILTINASEAASCGASFYEGNEMVWLADEIAPEFITK